MKRITWLVILELIGLGCAALVGAQSLSPVTAEGGKGKLKGQFTVSNPEVIKMVTTVSARSATFSSDGSVSYRQLDPDVTVQLQESSALIGPRQSHTFYFTAECRNPKSCIVIFLPSSSFGRAANGMQVKVVLPFTTYICMDGARDCRKRLRAEAGIK